MLLPFKQLNSELTAQFLGSLLGFSSGLKRRAPVVISDVHKQLLKPRCLSGVKYNTLLRLLRVGVVSRCALVLGFMSGLHYIYTLITIMWPKVSNGTLKVGKHGNFAEINGKIKSLN